MPFVGVGSALAKLLHAFSHYVWLDNFNASGQANKLYDNSSKDGVVWTGGGSAGQATLQPVGLTWSPLPHVILG